MNPQTPDKKSRYKPRLQNELLRNLIDRAYRAKYDEFAAADELVKVGAWLTSRFTSLYPAKDMAVLKRYKLAREQTSSTVQVYSPQTQEWGCWVGVQFSEAVVVPDSESRMVYCGGPRWSETPSKGVTEQYQDEMKREGTWKKFCVDQEERERACIPREWEPFFERLRQLKDSWGRAFTECLEWICKYREEEGKYPVWGQIFYRYEGFGMARKL